MMGQWQMTGWVLMWMPRDQSEIKVLRSDREESVYARRDFEIMAGSHILAMGPAVEVVEHMREFGAKAEIKPGPRVRRKVR